MDESKLMRMKENIDAKKRELEEQKTRLKILQEQLLKDFECSTIEEAQALVDKLHTKQEQLMEKYEVIIKQLEEYDEII